MASIFKRSPEGSWLVSYFDHTGRRRNRSTRTTDYRAAQRIAAKLEADAALRREGVIDVQTERLCEADRVPLKSHVADYLTHMERAGRSAQHVADARRVLADFQEKSRAARLTEVTQQLVEQYLADQRGKNGARSLNRKRGVFSAFFRWAIRGGRVSENPITGIPEQNEAADHRRKRRALTPEELQRLFAVAERSGRRAFYAAAYYGGLRRSEIGRLRWADIDFERAQLTVNDGKAKGRIDVIPLHGELAAQLLRIRAPAAHPSVRVFPEIVSHETRRADFEAAGINPRTSTPDGRRIEGTARRDEPFADLHSLRVTLGTDLARLGVPPQAAQRLLRHSTIEVTMRHYVKLRLDDLSGAMGRIAAMPQAADGARVKVAAGAEAVGTEAAPIDERQQNRQQSRHEEQRSNAIPCDERHVAEPAGVARNPSVSAPLRDPVRRAACMVRGGGIEPPRVAPLDPKSTDSPGAAAPDSRNDSTRPEIDADLRVVVEAWSQLPDALRGAVLAIVKAAPRG